MLAPFHLAHATFWPRVSKTLLSFAGHAALQQRRCAMTGRSSWNVPPSLYAITANNPTHGFVERADLIPNAKKGVIPLSIGDPTVFGNLLPCEEILAPVVPSLRNPKNYGYIPSTGVTAAKEAVAEYSSNGGVKVKPQDVILTCGCAQALDMCITVLANRGQNILIPRPGFCIYKTHAEFLSITVKYYNLLPERSWEVDLAHLESQIDPNTAAIVVNNPSNPCGSVFGKQHLKDILAVAAKHYLPIISDEINEYIVFEGQEYFPMAALSEDVPILACSALTKRFLVPGWRTGWIIIHDRHDVFARGVKKGLQNLSQKLMGGSSLVQGALPSILKNTPKKFFDRTISVVQKNAEVAYKVLSTIPGLRPVMPQGAMYLLVGLDVNRFPKFASDTEFVLALFAEESVLCLPGQCFDYPNYFRIMLTVPEEMLVEALDRIVAFCKAHYTP
ncbi:tyrosine aminotransferase isoform X2 [Dermacentor silvarum]|uniref:tyrosine aminotransferase isoform X2 n=1 Tax=Dermacentor silvarum TaxID=543639 RepID=UPI0021010B93|nr:tyrosine aminotransferase isoform X2 [Dermacentor silvarum]